MEHDGASATISACHDLFVQSMGVLDLVALFPSDAPHRQRDLRQRFLAENSAALDAAASALATLVWNLDHDETNARLGAYIANHPRS